MNVSQYAKENPRCEFCGRPAIQTHHIWGGTRRLDHRSNLIRLCLGCHDKCHDQPRVGRIKCMTAKFANGEFDEAELSEAASLNVIGWIENQGTPEALRLLTAIKARDNGRTDNRSGDSVRGGSGVAPRDEGLRVGEGSEVSRED